MFSDATEYMDILLAMLDENGCWCDVPEDGAGGNRPRSQPDCSHVYYSYCVYLDHVDVFVRVGSQDFTACKVNGSDGCNWKSRVVGSLGNAGKVHRIIVRDLLL